MDRCSELPRRAASRTQRDLHLDSAFRIERTALTDARLDDGADHVGVHKRIGLWWDAQPNGSRLSCGAKLAYSQSEFYNTACKTFSVRCGRISIVNILVWRRSLSAIR